MRKNAIIVLVISFVILILCLCVGSVMTINGISITQRAMRNTSRRKALEDLNLVINKYYSENREYPSYGEDGLVLYPDRAEIDGEVVLRFREAAKPTNSGLPTQSDGSQYCYIRSDESYRLGVSLEGEDWGLQLGDPSLPDCRKIYRVK